MSGWTRKNNRTRYRSWTSSFPERVFLESTEALEVPLPSSLCSYLTTPFLSTFNWHSSQPVPSLVIPPDFWFICSFNLLLCCLHLPFLQVLSAKQDWRHAKVILLTNITPSSWQEKTFPLIWEETTLVLQIKLDRQVNKTRTVDFLGKQICCNHKKRLSCSLATTICDPDNNRSYFILIITAHFTLQTRSENRLSLSWKPRVSLLFCLLFPSFQFHFIHFNVTLRLTRQVHCSQGIIGISKLDRVAKKGIAFNCHFWSQYKGLYISFRSTTIIIIAGGCHVWSSFLSFVC